MTDIVNCIKCGGTFEVDCIWCEHVDYICEPCFVDKFGKHAVYNPIFSWDAVNQILGYIDRDKRRDQ